MIERWIGPTVEWMSELIPGWKTKIVAGVGIGMVICEISGYIFQYSDGTPFGHAFSVTTWNMIPFSASFTILLRKYREAKKEIDKLKPVEVV